MRGPSAYGLRSSGDSNGRCGNYDFQASLLWIEKAELGFRWRPKWIAFCLVPCFPPKISTARDREGVGLRVGLGG